MEKSRELADLESHTPHSLCRIIMYY